MKNWLKKIIGIKSINKPKISWINEVESKQIKEVLQPDVKNMTSYEYAMISKRNRLSILPQSDPFFLQERLKNQWDHKARFVAGVDTPLPKHYLEMIEWGFTLDFDGFSSYTKAKKLSWIGGHSWQLNSRNISSE